MKGFGDLSEGFKLVGIFVDPGIIIPLLETNFFSNKSKLSFF